MNTKVTNNANPRPRANRPVATADVPLPAWLVACSGSCGNAELVPRPDVRTEGHDLTIQLFKHLPFVGGDTEVAPLLAIQDGDGDID